MRKISIISGMGLVAALTFWALLPGKVVEASVTRPTMDIRELTIPPNIPTADAIDAV